MQELSQRAVGKADEQLGRSRFSFRVISESPSHSSKSPAITLQMRSVEAAPQGKDTKMNACAN